MITAPFWEVCVDCIPLPTTWRPSATSRLGNTPACPPPSCSAWPRSWTHISSPDGWKIWTISSYNTVYIYIRCTKLQLKMEVNSARISVNECPLLPSLKTNLLYSSWLTMWFVVLLAAIKAY